MQYLTLIALLFTASAIAAPIAQITAVGSKSRIHRWNANPE